MALKKNELYLYCFYPNNRCHDAKEKDLNVNKEDHCMTQHIVKKEDIPDNLADYTYDGSKFEKIKDIEEERQLFSLRQERNRLIAETDWWASADLTMTTEQKFPRPNATFNIVPQAQEKNRGHWRSII